MFEALAIPRPARKVWLAGPAALLLHAAAVGAILAVSLWKTGDVEPPTVRISFAPVPLLPPPASGRPDSPAGHGEGRPREGVPTPFPAVVPAVIPSTVPTVVAPESAAAPGIESSSAGEEAGRPDGAGGGTGTVPATGPEGVAIDATAPEVVRPQLLFGPQPDYPEASRHLREQGFVVLQAIIGTDGRIQSATILRGVSPALDDAALRAISRWRYSPATLNRRAIRVYLTVTVRFALH